MMQLTFRIPSILSIVSIDCSQHPSSFLTHLFLSLHPTQSINQLTDNQHDQEEHLKYINTTTPASLRPPKTLNRVPKRFFVISSHFRHHQQSPIFTLCQPHLWIIICSGCCIIFIMHNRARNDHLKARCISKHHDNNQRWYIIPPQWAWSHHLFTTT